MNSLRAERRSGDASPSAAAPRLLRIAVIGSGHVGLVSAACLASHGHQVTAIDVDAALVERLARGQVTPHESGLAELVQAQAAAERLRFTTDATQALADAELVFVAVGGPEREDGSTETSAIDELTACIAATVRAPAVVVIKSTVSVGTTQRMQGLLNEWCADPADCPTVLVNPAFLRQGSALADFMSPDRIVIGDDSSGDAARRLLLDAYAPWVDAGIPVLTMDTRSAELAKHAASAMLAMRVSFINEVAAIADATGADIGNVCAGIGSDPRIGTAFLRPGLGYGGACFPDDVAALRETARRHNLRADLLLATERVNDRQRCWAFAALQRDAGSHARLRHLRVAVWGLAFKPGTDDMRHAPSLALVDRLVRAGALVTVYDPGAMESARREIAAHRRIEWARSAEAAIEGADVLMLVTEWPEFVAFEPAVARRALRLRTVYDGRNALDARRWAEAGVRVVQVGRLGAVSGGRGFQAEPDEAALGATHEIAPGMPHRPRRDSAHGSVLDAAQHAGDHAAHDAMLEHPHVASAAAPAQPSAPARSPAHPFDIAA